uniref:Uncharacterized protein n=1 Tax=Arundo donax TaxID=35708 RepID=A0A0A9D1H2_ARUDO
MAPIGNAIFIGSLSDGHRALHAAAPGRRRVIVGSVRVRDAPALKELLRGDGWLRVNKNPLAKLARAAGLLYLLNFNILPALVNNPVNGPWLRDLVRFGNRLDGLATQVGGSFRARAVSLAKGIRRFASDCRNGRRSPLTRGDRARLLRGEVTALREALVTIRQQ